VSRRKTESDFVVGTMGGESLENDSLAKKDSHTFYTHRVCPKCEGMLYLSSGWYFCGCGFVTSKRAGLFDMRADFWPKCDQRSVYPGSYAEWHRQHFGRSVDESLQGG